MTTALVESFAGRIVLLTVKGYRAKFSVDGRPIGERAGE